MIQMDFRWKFMSKIIIIKQIMNGGMAMSSYKIIKKSIAESGGKGRIR